MGAPSAPLPLLHRLPKNGVFANPNPNPTLLPRSRRAGGDAAPTRTRAVDGAAPPVEITWQIAVGALAGVTPFVVAGIEFGKRIVAQKKCQVCGGSGLVLRKDYYTRCPGCGGFLPWQSWKRFFKG